MPSEVKVLVTRLEDNKTWPVSAPHLANKELGMVSSLSWAGHSVLAVNWMENNQRSAVFSLCSLQVIISNINTNCKRLVYR